ncbi:MAG: phospholipid/cholesterol/gamma-HCH transport system substrate-binding protein [Solirubrobacteraceae bacterium]|jgi:phospholipid/cholesterol/gamma-HCH transport system substrate-binding protein|nr:phospholipid/cholesterol/gamma-HCH transport system substrate-binding protein [Solirubrobacteraceae bacterium]
MKRIIRKNLGPFMAIIGLVGIAVLVGGYILHEQRLRFPLLESKPVRINVALDNAQAVTPGQGQTAQIAGVKIGDIAEVKLDTGRAIVGLDIKPKFADLIHRDAKAVLRPRTGLKDMYVQIFPGRDGPPVKEGFTIPVQSSLTDVDLDEILSQLDTRTRDYVTLLANGAGEGLRGRGSDLARVFKRFGPTVRDLSRVNHAVGTERVALRRLVTSLAQVNGALARKPQDLTRLVSTASTTLHAIASEDVNLRGAVTELAPTLQQATRTLDAVTPFANELGPTTRALLPAVRQLENVNAQVSPFAREATPIIRDKIRPFTRKAQPLARDLAPAARGLSRAFPEIDRNLTVVNHFTNMLGDNPGGAEPPEKAGRDEGYLFWLSWLTHQTSNLQSTEDANGPIRPIFVTATCDTFTSLVNDLPQAEFALGLSPLLATVCKNPTTASLNTTRAVKAISGGGQTLGGLAKKLTG